MKTNYTKKRLREIVSVSVKHGLKGGINNPSQLREALEELGPTFIKIGQILSTRPDILSKEYILELQRLQDDVKPEKFEMVKNAIESELNNSLEENFAIFEEEPIASASLSQVHYAELKTGEKVVVKVQRPNAKKMMMADIDILRKLAPFINLTPTGSAMDAKEVIEELAAATKKELDFINEAKNTKCFREKNKDVKFILCPKIYEDYCTEKIIVMDYIEGIKIDNIDKLKEEGYDLKDLATKLTYNYFKQIFEDGFFHADPHPGNIFLCGRKIGYIDFGLMGVLDDNLRKKFNDFLEAVANRDVNLMTKSVMKIGQKRGPVDRSRLYEDIEIIYDQYIEESIQDFDLPQIIEEIFKVCKDNNIYMPKDITLLVKGLMTIQGLIAKLDSEINIMDIALPYVKEHITNEKLKDLNSIETLRSLYEIIKSNLILSSKIIELIEQIKAGNLRTQIEFKESEEASNELNKMVNRLIFGMIVAGLVVSSSIVINANVGLKIYGISAFGLIGYLGAAIAGFWLLISIIKSGKL
ncbi:AarF/ABC1/UbiB kinase family protein [Anaerosalibacter bizertensis]|uniref:AarF/ABC1/UbiB kinase family protein n=1 Tax=Anaerosalibacter bizertensis TaxID=932217 RepID=A0A9Q4ACW0_9FIRM|nr:AarF/ABC1/UbiB kinase family protein [Anaerosalibacter bizertensis]MBV1817979.1 AarF/ABC1/UbiB kinase family protein [Bacteroidales bacterium MSK.15.36]MCB5559335.1 AarF/ABC1/UbiB kinase family protein [Anaerosalibacter bizertensis]MCG4565218.1 AarF/ABC1/UbiB kinase family protein [Anaerosalibacter bizertensis]MCG4581990.1 AarF/ABC1/UbiB kinase family protein [Anaerosalibacter bizertensis]